MLRTRSLTCALTLLSISAVLFAQVPSKPVHEERQDYFGFISRLPWDVEKLGPLVVVCPAKVAHGKSLQELQRKEVRIGGLTSFVPTRMITLNSQFKDSPNLYDGLPRSAKVLYLLTLLNEDQWRKIAGEGLTLGDCHGEQADVMQSIIPNPFKYTIGTVSGPRSITHTGWNDPQQLSNQERAKVKLRVYNRLELTLPLVNDGGFTGTSVRDSDQPEGSKMAFLRENDGDEFGQHIKIESENTPRRSHLDLTDTRFDVKIPLKKEERLRELLARISSATGVSLATDIHFGPMSMYELGKEASARDLLKAITYGVCGTFRKLGNLFLLTNDLEGVAVHQARIAAFEDDLGKLVQERESQMRAALAGGNGLSKLVFTGSQFGKLTDTEAANLTHNDNPHTREQYINVSEASAAIRQEVMESVKSNGNPIDPTKVGVHSSKQFTFILPNGGKTWNVGWLGSSEQYDPSPYVWQPPKPEPVSLPMAPAKNLRALLFRADSTQAALTAVTRVSQLGIGEVWLETTRPNVLAAAIKAGEQAGIKVTVAIRPWASDSSEVPLDPDRTAGGIHGKGLALRKQSYISLQRFWEEASAFPPITREQLSPLDPQTSARLARFVDLASMKGIAGTVVLDAFPSGYAKKRSRSSGSYYFSPAVNLLTSFGYSEAQRLAFFQSEHVDPLDMEDDAVRTEASFYDVWGDAWGNTDRSDQWQQSRGQWALDAVMRLLNGIAPSGVPILVSPQPSINSMPPPGMSSMFAWKPGSELATAPEDWGGTLLEKTSDLAVINIIDENDLDQRARVASSIWKRFTKSEKPVVLDFSGVPNNQLDLVLKRWLKKG